MFTYKTITIFSFLFFFFGRNSLDILSSSLALVDVNSLVPARINRCLTQDIWDSGAVCQSQWRVDTKPEKKADKSPAG